MISLLVKTITKGVFNAINPKISLVDTKAENALAETVQVKATAQNALTEAVSATSSITLLGENIATARSIAENAQSTASAATVASITSQNLATEAKTTATDAMAAAQAAATAAAAAAAAASSASSAGIDAATLDKINKAYAVVETAMDDTQLDTIKEIADRIKSDAAEVVTLRSDMDAKFNTLFATQNGSILTMNSTELEAYIAGLVAEEVAAQSV